MKIEKTNKANDPSFPIGLETVSRLGWKLFPLLLVVFVFLFVGFANAEVATLKKSLIWSADNSSDYKLPEISGGVYTTQDFIATDGQINSITVNYQASGKINFEVSADSGLNYAQVTNGVPLKGGFISGNRLRWRAQALTDDAKLYKVNINYTDTAGVLENFGEPSLSGFLYRKAIQIEKSETQELYNYQLKLRIGENESVKDVDVNLGGRTLADFKDLRFSAADGQTPLPYYMESLEGDTGSRIATVWVKIPQIPKEGVIFYLYYGNDTAVGLSDPNATFDFYEDFTAVSLDKNKWVIHTDPKGSAQPAKGTVKLDAAEIITKEFQFKEGIIEYSSSAESGFESSLNVRNKNEETYDSPIWLAYSSIYKGAEHCIAVDGIVKTNDPLAKLTVAGEKYNYRITLDSGKIIFERFDSLNKETQASASYNIDPMPKAGYLSLRSGGDGAGKNIINFGAIRARKAAANLPVYNIGKEERVSLPIFVDTQLSSYGNLILKDVATSGYYISPDIASVGEVTRIIIPSWKVDPTDATTVGVSISADSAATYKKECENSKYYYASKKDFSAGSSLKARVDLSRENTGEKSSGLSAFSLDYRPGKITVTSPGKGDTLNQATAKILWSATEYEQSYLMKLEYSLDRGKTYKEITGKTGNSGEYLWSIPTGINSRRALVKVSDSFDDSINAVSNGAFSIMTAQEPITAPAAVEVSAEKTAVPVVAQEKKKEKESPANLYDLLIKVGDNVSAAGYKDGDIIMIKPAGYLWSTEEKARFLIIRAKLTPERAQELIQPKQKIISSGWLGRKKTAKTLNKRRYSINLRGMITSDDRELAGQGKLNGKPIEVEDIATALQEKRGE